MKLTAVYRPDTNSWTIRLAGRELDDTIETFYLNSIGFVQFDDGDGPGENATLFEVTLVGNLEYD